MTALLVTSIAVTLIAAVGTEVLRARAHAWGLIDVPNERSLHSRVTPRGGGIVLVLTALAGLAVMAVSGHAEPWSRAVTLGLASLTVAVVGWRDDLRPLPPHVKFPVHLIAAAVMVAAWGSFDRVQLPGLGELPLPAVPAAILTAVWIVGLLNAYNFMDGIDGIAAGQAVVAGIAWAYIGTMTAPLVTVVAVLIAAASAGFLWHNRPPARIFLGDAGSGFLGFSFAALPIIAYRISGDVRLPAAGALILAPFIFDTTFTLFRRAMRRENLVQAHRTHLYQRLVLSGWSHARVTALYLSLAVVSAAAAVLWIGGVIPVVAAPVLAAIAALPLFVARVERAKGS